MNVKQRRVGLRKLAVAAAGLVAIAFTAMAQVQTQTNVTPGPATHSVTVERGTIVYVEGNNVVVEAEDGTLRHFDNVPESTTVTVDGKQLNVHELQPGMKVERQTITTTTPRMITTIKTVTGKVWQIQPPNWVILTLENGENQKFTIPKGTKFTVNGRETDAFGLRKGMKVNAQQVTESPETVIAREVKRTGTMPPPPPAPQADVPILVVVVRPAKTEQPPAEPAEKVAENLPKTASYFPLIGLVGILSIGLGLGVKTIRTMKA